MVRIQPLFSKQSVYVLSFCACSSAIACATVLKYAMKRETGCHVNVSCLFIYHNARRLKRPYGVLNDHGVSLKYCVKAVEKYGFCEEEHWPYNEELVNTRPPQLVYERANQYTIAPKALPINIKSFKAALVRDELPMVAIYLYPSAGEDVIRNEGRIPLPDANSITAKTSPWHSVVFVGYDDVSKHFIVRNSWSARWVRRDEYSLRVDLYGYILFRASPVISTYLTNISRILV